MCAALCIINIVAKSQHIFVKFIDILKGSFHLNAFRLSFKINRLMDDFLLFIEFFNKSQDSIRLMISDLLRFTAPSVFIYNCQGRIQVSRLMHTALYLFSPEAGLFKDRIVRKEVYLCPGFSCLCNPGQKSVFQLYDRDSSLIAVVMHISFPADLHIHIG